MTSTAEAEMNVVALDLVEASWKRDIVGELQGRSNPGQFDGTLVNNNKACLVKLNSSLYKPRNKPLGTKFHCI